MTANDPVTDRLRAICLELPESAEKEAWGDPTFRIRNRIFAMEKRGDGRISVWCKSTPDVRDALLLAAPSLFFVPPYVGSTGTRWRRWCGTAIG